MAVILILNFFKSYKELIYIIAGYTVIFILFRISFLYTLPFLVGFIFAAVMQPVYRHLRKAFRIKSGFAAAAVTTMIFLIIISIICILTVMLINQLLVIFSEITASNQQISSIIAELIERFEDLTGRFNFNIIPDGNNVMDSLGNGIENLQRISGYLMSAVSFVPTLVTMVIVSVFATYYFTVNFEKIKDLFSRTVDKFGADKTHEYLLESKLVLKKFFRGYMLVYGITFIVTLALFLVFRIRFAFLFAVLSGIADVLPILGPSAVYVPLAIVHYLQGNNYLGTVILIGLAVINIVRQFVEPKIVSDSISISPLAGIAALYFSLLAKSLWVFVYLMVLFMLISVYNKISKEEISNDTSDYETAPRQ